MVTSVCTVQLGDFSRAAAVGVGDTGDVGLTAFKRKLGNMSANSACSLSCLTLSHIFLSNGLYLVAAITGSSGPSGSFNIY